MNWKISYREEKDIKSDIYYIGLGDINKLIPRLKPY